MEFNTRTPTLDILKKKGNHVASLDIPQARRRIAVIYEQFGILSKCLNTVTASWKQKAIIDEMKLLVDTAHEMVIALQTQMGYSELQMDHIHDTDLVEIYVLYAFIMTSLKQKTEDINFQRESNGTQPKPQVWIDNPAHAKEEENWKCDIEEQDIPGKYEIWKYKCEKQDTEEQDVEMQDANEEEMLWELRGGYFHLREDKRDIKSIDHETINSEKLFEDFVNLKMFDDDVEMVDQGVEQMTSPMTVNPKMINQNHQERVDQHDQAMVDLANHKMSRRNMYWELPIDEEMIDLEIRHQETVDQEMVHKTEANKIMAERMRRNLNKMLN
ncbi:hypothetical protein GGR54DRAFT_643338 [Hypoxylon sp. NC1633]|nr:hypothetical protein GGR54DRAFT_643338 [Hypoxylon sp. NC1633]